MTVASGARSLRSVEHGETFHPVVGPMVEARSLHVAQSRIVERAGECARPFVVWDVGLGAGANAVAAIESLHGTGTSHGAEIHSFDCTDEPLAFALRHAEDLEYPVRWLGVIMELLETGTAAAGCMRWHFHRGDFRQMIMESKMSALPAPDAIFYDPYSPAANPGMWTLEHFGRLRALVDASRHCTLTSYSRSTSVRVTLALAGFHIGRGGSTGEKDETTVAATHRELLAHPLGLDWLERVERSTRGAPLREGATPGPVAPDDFAALREFLAVR